MGKKLITEADFWECSGGLMPTQIQSSQNIAKTPEGDRYITQKDTSTVSFGDFACKKAMFIMALLVALVAVLAVATGGAGLIAIGAMGGAVGAAAGAGLGTLICGHRAATARKWETSKKNLFIKGIPTINGEHTMICLLFEETITYNENIKTWYQAFARGGSNLLSGVLEGAMNGAFIGMGGGAFNAIKPSLSLSKPLLEVAKAGMQFLKSAPKNFAASLKNGVFFGMSSKAIGATNTFLDRYAETGVAKADYILEGVKEATFGDIDTLKNICSGNGGFEDYKAAVLLFTPMGGKTTPAHSGK